jgi:hypothetical protein
MELVEIEITGQVITAQYGTLNSGAVLRTSAEFAKHLIDDCGAAKYRGADAKQVERAPTVAELLAARDVLQVRERELDERARRLDEQEAANVAEAARLAEQVAANAAEAQRLAGEAGKAAAAPADGPAAKAGKAGK